MKMPPKQKILEAYSAIADHRITMKEQEAECVSSDGSKTYAISWDGDTYASSDNATYWQGYPGYPVLAVLLLQGRLTYDEKLVSEMAGIPWKKLNDSHKRDYEEAAREGMKDIPDQKEILALAEKNNEELSHLNLTMKRKIRRTK